MNLTDRLPPKIYEFQRWKELFEAIDEYWEQNITPAVDRLKNLRSVFTASEEDLTIMLEELTSYFDYASDELAKPLSIFWKRNEINNKNSEWAVEALLQRINISAKDIHFKRLFAPKDTVTNPYGTVFYTDDQLIDLEADYNDYFLSSHMILEIDLDDVLEHGWNEDEIRTVMNRYFEENIRPTHIVFDGLNFFIFTPTKVSFVIGTQSNRVSVCKLIPS